MTQMVTNRLPITVPAAGTYLEVPTSGHLIYVESTDLSTDPSDVVTLHLQRDGDDGFPLFPKMRFKVCERFTRFWIKGNTADATATIRLLIVSDPCMDFEDVVPNPCNPAAAAAALGTDYTLFFVWANASASPANSIRVTPKTAISWSTFLSNDPATVDVRDMWADYQNHYLYWCTGSDGATQVSGIYRAAYDPTTGAIVGTHETLLTGSTSINMRGIAVDTVTGRIYVSDHSANRISWIPITGGSATLLTGVFSNPNRMAFYLDPATTLGILHICLDGVGEIMEYDIDSETDLGTLIGPAGTDYDEISAHPAGDFVIYRRDAGVAIRSNDWGTYLTENAVWHAGSGGSIGQIFVDRVNARGYWMDGTGFDIRSQSFAGGDLTDHGALPTASVALYPRMCLG